MLDFKCNDFFFFSGNVKKSSKFATFRYMNVKSYVEHIWTFDNIKIKDYKAAWHIHLNSLMNLDDF